MLINVIVKWLKSQGIRVLSSSFIWLILSGFIFSGCSLGGLFQRGPDNSVLKTTNYRKLNADCSFKADSPEMDVLTFRSVLRCLNTHHAFNHALDKTEVLIDNMTDDQLQPIVQVANKYILTNKKRLYEIETTVKALKSVNVPNSDAKLIQSTIDQFGKISKNGQFISSALALVKDGFLVDAKTVDPDILKVMEIFSKELTPNKVDDILRFGINVSSAEAFHDLYGSFKKGLQAVPTLKTITDGVFNYSQSKHFYNCAETVNGSQKNTKNDIKQDFYYAIKNGSLKDVFENIFTLKVKETQRGTLSDPLRDKISRVSLVLKAFSHATGNSHELIKRLGVAFQELSDPFTCLKTAVEISSPTLLIVSELIDRMSTANSSRADASAALAHYALKENPLSFTFLQEPVCSLPSDKLSKHYPTLRDLALFAVVNPSKTVEPLILPMTEFLGDIYSETLQPWNGCDGKTPSGDKQHFITQLLIHVLSDIDPSLDQSDSSNKRGVDFLIPLINELSARDAWTDILLVATLPSDLDRDQFDRFLKFVVESNAQLGNKPIADVILDAMGRLKNPIRLYNLISSLKEYVNLDDDFLEQVLVQFQYIYHVNTVHPFFDLVTEITSEASQNPEFFRVLFEISGEMVGLDGKKDQYLANALSELAVMTEKPDQVIELLDAVINITTRFAAQAKGEVQVRQNLISNYIPYRRHSFTRKDIREFEIKKDVQLSTSEFGISEECLGLNYSVSLLTGSGTRFEEQLRKFLNCFNSDGQHGDLAKSVQYLQSRQVHQGGSKNLYRFLVDFVGKFFEGSRSLGQSGVEFRYLVDSWMFHFNGAGNYFNRVLNGLGAWTSPLFSKNIKNREPVIAPLLRVIGGSLKGSKADVEKLEEFLGSELARDDFPPFLKDLEELLTMDLPAEYQGAPPTPSLDQELGIVSASQDLVTNDDGTAGRVLAKAWNGPIERPFDDRFVNTLKEWVINKECLPESGPVLEARMIAILNEGRDNLNNIEYVAAKESEGLELRKVWEFNDLKARLEPIVKKFGDLKQEPGSKPPLNAQIDFFKYFNKSAISSETTFDDPFLKDQIVPHFEPDWLRNWFYDRAIDYRLITYMDPQGNLRVRIVNSLDLFELVTANGDFLAPWPISKNLGIKNLASIGQAWGDLDESFWPQGIKNLSRYGGATPRTIRGAIADIKPPVLSEASWWSLFNLSDLRNLTANVVGLPPVQSCVKPVRGEAEVPQPTLSSSTLGWAYFRLMPEGQEKRRQFQIKLYNVWQTIPVLDDNAPNKDPSRIFNGTPQNGYRTSYSDGLEFFRNLFYQLYYSTPASHQGFQDDIALKLDANHLTLISYSNQLGTLRVIGKLIQNLRRDDPAFHDLMTTLSHASLSNQFFQILAQIFSTDDGKELLWNILREAYQLVDSGGPEDIARLKKMGYYLAALLNRVEPWVPPSDAGVYKDINPDFLETSLGGIREALLTPEYVKFFANGSNGLLKDILTSTSAPSMIRKVYSKISEREGGTQRALRLKNIMSRFLEKSSEQDLSRIKSVMNLMMTIYSSNDHRDDLRSFLEQRETLVEKNEYFKRLQLADALHPLLLFFQESNRDATGMLREPFVKDLAKRIRVNLAESIKDHDIHEFFKFASESPDQIDQILKTLNRYIGEGDSGELKEFLKVVQGRLSAPKY